MKLHCRVIGQGAPLIILHGLLGSLVNWQTMARRFARHFTVLSLDQRNHGQSPHGDHMSYGAMADDLLETMDEQGIATGHLLGHSMGGKTAMQFALRHSERVGKLVVVDVAPRAYAQQHAHILKALMNLRLTDFARRDELDAALAESVRNPVTRGFLLKNAVRNAAGAFEWKPNLRALWENQDELAAAVTADASYSKPALFIRGEKSDAISQADLDLIRRMFSSSIIHDIPGAGHWVHADQPEAFYRTALDFLAGDFSALDAEERSSDIA